MRGCELKGLRWKDVDLEKKTLTIRRENTKTDASARVIPLNRDAGFTLSEMLTRAERLGAADPEHYVFPSSEGRWRREGSSKAHGVIDPTRPMKSWRTAWRSLTKAAGIKGLRFHDLRHHSITELCEAGVSEGTITSVAGHVSQDRLRHYSHPRLQAKREAVARLEGNLPMASISPQDE